MGYGVINSDLITTSDGVSSAGLYGLKNRLINGDMRIDQRNAGASVSAALGVLYTLDRFSSVTTVAAKFTVQQNAASVTPPVGFTNYLGVTSSSAYSVSSSDYFTLQQSIEGYNIADLAWGTANAATVTLSFWVRSSLTGTFGGAIYNSAGDRSYPFTYTINSANTWEKETITIVGDTSGTWLTTNGVGMRINWGLGVGSTASGTAGSWSGTLYRSATGATSVVGTSGATFYITGVQLEKGSTATSFDYLDYGRSLAQCQRYFQKYTNVMMVSGYNGTSGSIFGTWIFPVPLRATPTMVYGNFANVNSGNATANNASSTEFRVVATITSTGAGYSTFTAETSGAEL